MKLKHYAITLFLAAIGTGAQAQTTPQSQMEPLDRGLVVISSGTTKTLSWRFLGTDDEDRTTFAILCDGDTIISDQYTTFCTTTKGKSTSEYQVVTLVDGTPTETSKPVKAWTTDFLTLSLARPEGGTHRWRYTNKDNKTQSAYFDNVAYDYSPNDCSVGDVDGDGQYELILKWDPSHSQDNSYFCGPTGSVYLDCYKIDGSDKLLWRIDLGNNIRAGAHYTQFLVYDFNGDGKAEIICKTAPGSKDGKGNYVNQAATDATIKNHDNTADYRTEEGVILSGPEYLTVFNGETGEAIHTIWYLPNRGGTFNEEKTYQNIWGKSDKGNRGDRFLGAVAYLDGPDQLPSAVFSRGYYARAFVWAVDFDGEQLHTKWLSDSESINYVQLYTGDELTKQPRKAYVKNTGGVKSTDSDGGIAGSNTMYSNGNHNLSVADVDGDGCDEIIWGSATLDNNGLMLYSVGYGHGDAIHVSDLLPDRPGLEVFDVHEEKILNDKGSWDLHDAATGEVIYKGGSNGTDNGRGMAADISKDFRGFEFWSSDDRTPRRGDTGEATGLKNQSVNFRIYWNGDLYDELLDGHYASAKNYFDEDVFDHVDQVNITTANASRIQQWTNRSTCNTTKMTPNLSADILGDWREELVLWDYNDPTKLYIHTTTTTTNYRMPTLMHDHVYRMGIAWQQTAYNQPPHLGFYLPDAMLPQLVNDEKVINVEQGQEFSFESKTRYMKTMSVTASFLPDGSKKSLNVPDGMTKNIDMLNRQVTFGGKLTEAGDYLIALKLTGLGNEVVYDTLTVRVNDPAGITTLQLGILPTARIYDAAGRLMPQQQLDRLPRGLYILREGKNSRKVMIR